MANYIDRSILCESYIYVKKYDLTPDKKTDLQRLLNEYAQSRAPIFFGSDIEIESEAIEGSLKLRVTVAVATLTNLFIHYGSLRTSIDYLVKDAQTVASAFVTESMFAAGVRSDEVARTEVRVGVPGALKRIISKLDVLADSSDTIPPEEFATNLAGIRAELTRILETIAAEEDKKTVARGMRDILSKQYPPPPPEPVEYEGEPPAAIQRREDIDAFLEELRLLAA